MIYFKRALEVPKALCSLAIVVGLCGCAPRLDPNQVAGDAATSNNLWKVWLKLYVAVGNGDTFPKTLADVNWSSTELEILASPISRTKPGVLANVEEWTDYIYVGNHTDTVPGAALVISPPENHNGRYGYVVCVDGHIERVSSDLARQLVNQPWSLATNSPSENIEYLKRRVTVHVPKKLINRYPHPYRAQPPQP